MTITDIAVNPLVMKNVVLTLGTNGYSKHISGVTFTPKSSSITWKGLDPDATFTDVTKATWTADLDYVQDWGTTDSLSAYLYENEGKAIAASFQPISGSGPSFTATLTITPGAIGGKVDTYADASVSLGSTRPVLVPAV